MPSESFPLSTTFDPAFGDVMEKVRAAAAAKGIKTHYISGVRSQADQQQLYANYQAGLRGQPLPYPERGRVPLAAIPGTSLHERGLAADVEADDPSQQAMLRQIGNQFGLVTKGNADPNHFELASANIPKGGGTPGAIAYGPGGTQYAGPGVPQPPTGSTTINSPNAPVAGALAVQPTANSPYGNPFLDKLAQIESNNRNIPSGVDKDYPGQPGSKSQGYFQIDTPTWLQFAAKAGIDTTKYPNAMSAPPEVQVQVASQIPLSRFGARTQKMLGQQFGTLDKTQTIGAHAAQYAAATPSGPMDPSAIAHGSTVNPQPPSTGAAPSVAAGAPAAAPAVATTPAPDKSWWDKLTTAPTDAQGNPIANAKSPLQQLTEGSINRLGAEGQTEQQEAPQRSALDMQAPGARNVSPGLQNVAQIYGNTLNSFMQPLTWTSKAGGAPGMPAAGLQGGMAPQAPGVSLTSVPGMSGIDPNLGYGFG